MQDLPKIDCHHHLWDIEAHDYPWLRNPGPGRVYGDYSAMCRNYLVEDFLHDARPHKVVQSVHVQANWNPADPVGETRWLQATADRHGFPHGIIAHADLASDTLDRTLEAHCEFANVRGVRDIVGHTDNPHGQRPEHWATPEWERGYARLARYGLTFDLQAFPAQLLRLAPVAARHPEVPVVICHTGFPYDRSDRGNEQWQAAMSAFAALPHARVKLSGPKMVMPDWTIESFAPYVHRSIELFGATRAMVASNVPPDALGRTYDEIYAAFYAWTEGCSDSERRALFHDTAAAFYSL